MEWEGEGNGRGNLLQGFRGIDAPVLVYGPDSVFIVVVNSLLPLTML